MLIIGAEVHYCGFKKIELSTNEQYRTENNSNFQRLSNSFHSYFLILLLSMLNYSYKENTVLDLCALKGRGENQLP